MVSYVLFYTDCKLTFYLCIISAESILPAECFLAILQEALSDPVFVIDYKRMYPVSNDIDILQQACGDMYPFF